jgi:hypothetical protein
VDAKAGSVQQWCDPSVRTPQIAPRPVSMSRNFPAGLAARRPKHSTTPSPRRMQVVTPSASIWTGHAGKRSVLNSYVGSTGVTGGNHDRAM